MTTGQYRSLVAYMNFWTPQYPNMGLDQALVDCGITDGREEVIARLWSCCWKYNEKTGLLTYDDEGLVDDEPSEC